MDTELVTKIINRADEICQDELYALFVDKEDLEEFEQIYAELENLKMTNNDMFSKPYFDFYKKYFRPQAVSDLINLKIEIDAINTDTTTGV